MLLFFNCERGAFPRECWKVEIGELLQRTHGSALLPARNLRLDRWWSSEASTFAAPQGLGRYVPLMQMQKQTTPKLICVSLNSNPNSAVKGTILTFTLAHHKQNKGQGTLLGLPKEHKWNYRQRCTFSHSHVYFLAAERGMENHRGREKHSRTNIPVLVFVNILNSFCNR